MGIISTLLTENPESIHVITIAIFCCLLYHYIVYPIYFHPLAKIPGPKLACISKYYIIYKTGTLQRNNLVHELHEKYGSIVRVGPDEVDISDVAYLKDIYVNNFDKTQFYGQFGLFDRFNTFSSLTKLPHQKSRKISNKFYSKSSVTSPEIQGMVRNVIAKTIKLIDTESVAKCSSPINVYDIFQMMAMDAAATFSFGSKFYKPLLDDPFKYGADVIRWFRLRSSMMFWTTLLPRWRKYMTPEEVKEVGVLANDWLYSNTMNTLDGDRDSQCLANVLADGGKDRPEVAAEIGDHVAAGYQTTGITLSYCIWRLCLDKKVQKKLQDELLIFSNKSSYMPPTYQEVDNLPYLNAVLNETYRLYAAIPGQEPRLVPKVGMKWKGNKQTPELLIPAGTIVNMQPWTLHRDATIFENPEVWNPERWLIADEEKLKLMNKQMMTFGSGVRMCLGMNLAVEEMKLLVSSVYSRFSTELDELFDYEYNMHVEDLYTTHPRGHKCNIKFKAI